MKRIVFLLFAACCFTLYSATAQSDNTLLWEITGKGLKKPSYLFGTFHMLCPADLQVTDAVRTRLQTTQQLVLELDFDDPSAVAGIQQDMVFKNGKTTKDYLSENEYQLVNRFFIDSLGMPFEQVEAVKPFMLSTFIYPKYLGCAPASWELVLMQMAQAQSAEVLGLETPEQQLAVLDKMTFEQQAAFLVESIRDHEGMRKQFAEMLQLYKSQDVEALERFGDSYFEEFQALQRAILEDRNRAWIPKIEQWAKAKPSFFAVGAAHLGGKKGVIALLRAKGYKVRPVPNVDETAAVKTTDAGSPSALLLARKWRMDESIIPQAVEDLLDNMRQSNPEQAAALETQKEVLAQGLRAGMVEYKTNGRFEMLVLGQRVSGAWKLNDDHTKLLRTGDDGSETVNEVVEISAGKLVLINSSQKRLVYVPQ